MRCKVPATHSWGQPGHILGDLDAELHVSVCSDGGAGLGHRLAIGSNLALGNPGLQGPQAVLSVQLGAQVIQAPLPPCMPWALEQGQ